MLNKMLQIARREYLETVKTKAFIIGILLLPVIMGVMIFFGGKMQKSAFSGPREDIHALVLNHDSALDKTLAEAFDNYNADNPGRKIVTHFAQVSEEEGKQSVRSREYSVLLVVDEKTVEGSDHARLFSLPASDLTLQPTLNRIINNAVSTVRYEQNGFSPELIRKLSRNVWLEDIHLSDKGEGKINRMAGMFLPFILLMLIFFGIMTSSQGLLNSIIEEKNNRVIEVLLAAVNPLDMMAGKILGQSAIGLTLVALYVVGAVTAAATSGYGEILTTIGTDKIAVLIPNICWVSCCSIHSLRRWAAPSIRSRKRRIHDPPDADDNAAVHVLEYHCPAA